MLNNCKKNSRKNLSRINKKMIKGGKPNKKENENHRRVKFKQSKKKVAL